MKKISILYIDDEVHNLNAFRASFRRDYNVFTSVQIPEARKILAENDIPIIIADQRMPITTGIDFFKSIKKTHPDAIRILITAYTETKPLIDAINKGQIFRYVQKPWEYYDLRNTIANAYDVYETKKELNLKLKESRKIREERTQFIGHVSKNIQTTLQSSLGILNLAKNEWGNNEYIEALQNNFNQLIGFTRQTIGYYKNIDTQLQKESINFGPLIHRLKENYQYSDSDISFHIKINQKHPFYGDLFRVKTIIDNLLSNAIRFRDAQKEQLVISIELESKEDGVDLKITDNGMGIESDQLEKIFDLFYTGENENVGHGIGLYIAKSAVFRMDGTIDCSAVKGEGATFKVSLSNQVD